MNFVLHLISESFVIVATSIPLQFQLSIPNNVVEPTNNLREYISPTMNYNPMIETDQQLLQNLIDQILEHNK